MTKYLSDVSKGKIFSFLEKILKPVIEYVSRTLPIARIPGTKHLQITGAPMIPGKQERTIQGNVSFPVFQVLPISGDKQLISKKRLEIHGRVFHHQFMKGNIFGSLSLSTKRELLILGQPLFKNKILTKLRGLNSLRKKLWELLEEEDE